MSIFGTDYPRAKLGSTTVNFEHAVLDSNWSDPQWIEQVSPLDGTRNFITLGDYCEFRVNLHLHKYPSAYSALTPAEKFEDVYQLNHQLVTFLPHVDHFEVKDTSGSYVYFYVAEVIPYYIGNINSLDMVTLLFKSQKYVDLAPSLLSR